MFDINKILKDTPIKPHLPPCVDVDCEPLPLFERLIKANKKPDNKPDKSNLFIEDGTSKQFKIKSMCVKLMEQCVMDSDSGRNTFAHILACEALKVGYSDEEMKDAVVGWNARNNSALPDDEIEKVINSAINGYDYSTDNPVLSVWRARAVKEIESEKEKKEESLPSSLPSLFDIIERDDSITEKAKPVGPWLTWQGCITVLSSAPGKGKGLLLTYESLEVIRKGGTVMWVGTDEALGNVVIRFKEAGITPEESKHVKIGVMSEAPETWKHLFKVTLECKPDLLILDSLTTLVTRWWDKTKEIPDASKKEHWEEIVSGYFHQYIHNVHPLCSIIWLHHDVKEIGRGYFGSVGIAGATDVLIGLTRRKNDNIVILDVKKQRAMIDIPEEQFRLAYSKEKMCYTLMKTTAEIAGTAQSASQLVQDWVTDLLKDGSMIRDEIVKAFTEEFPMLSEATLNKVTAPRFGFTKSKQHGKPSMWSLTNEGGE